MCVCVCVCAGVSEGNQLRPALPGEPAHGRPEQRLQPRLQAQRGGGPDEGAGEGERDAASEGEQPCS